MLLGEPRCHIVNPPSNRGVQDHESIDGLSIAKLRCGSGSVGSPCGKGGTSVLIFLAEEIRDVNRRPSDVVIKKKRNFLPKNGVSFCHFA
jgi:hypothetical protein